MKHVLIAGGGAAGLYAAALLSEAGCRVTLIEKNEKTGKKLYITGKGRCNLTNCCPEEEFLSQVIRNPRFLYSAIYAENPERTMDTFSSWGLPLKTERGRRVFPVSDHAADVVDTLRKKLREGHVSVRLHTCAAKLLVTEEEGICRAAGIRTSGPEMEEIMADYVVLATGGRSYPSTGSTGDGYRIAADAGINVRETRPSLVPLTCGEEYVRSLQGLSLKNVRLTVRSGKKILFSEQGEMMFTHFGITGPLVLSASAVAADLIPQGVLPAEIDLKPAVTTEQLDARLLRLFSASPLKEISTVFGELYPRSLIPVVCSLSGLGEHVRVHTLTRENRADIVRITKHFPLTITGTRGYSEAVVTRGGIDVKEIDPGTMESKKIRNLFCIGELLDVDAFTGGYNLQIAWSTARQCAEAIALRASEYP